MGAGRFAVHGLEDLAMRRCLLKVKSFFHGSHIELFEEFLMSDIEV